MTGERSGLTCLRHHGRICRSGNASISSDELCVPNPPRRMDNVGERIWLAQNRQIPPSPPRPVPTILFGRSPRTCGPQGCARPPPANSLAPAECICGGAVGSMAEYAPVGEVRRGGGWTFAESVRGPDPRGTHGDGAAMGLRELISRSFGQCGASPLERPVVRHSYRISCRTVRTDLPITPGADLRSVRMAMRLWIAMPLSGLRGGRRACTAPLDRRPVARARIGRPDPSANPPG